MLQLHWTATVCSSARVSILELPSCKLQPNISLASKSSASTSLLETQLSLPRKSFPVCDLYICRSQAGGRPQGSDIDRKWPDVDIVNLLGTEGKPSARVYWLGLGGMYFCVYHFRIYLRVGRSTDTRIFSLYHFFPENKLLLPGSF